MMVSNVLTENKPLWVAGEKVFSSCRRQPGSAAGRPRPPHTALHRGEHKALTPSFHSIICVGPRCSHLLSPPGFLQDLN